MAKPVDSGARGAHCSMGTSGPEGPVGDPGDPGVVGPPGEYYPCESKAPQRRTLFGPDDSGTLVLFITSENKKIYVRKIDTIVISESTTLMAGDDSFYLVSLRFKGGKDILLGPVDALGVPQTIEMVKSKLVIS